MFFTPVCQSFCSQGGGSIPACLAGGIQACLAVLWSMYPSMPCRFPGPHSRAAWGVWPGGSPGPHMGGVSRPTPGVWRVSRSTPGGSPGPHSGRVYPSMHWGRPPPTQLLATAEGSTHLTGMHSCLSWFYLSLLPGLWNSDLVASICLHQQSRPPLQINKNSFRSVWVRE